MYYIIVGVEFFFFQAEDGIRYLVRSRGLGDVYKRQKLIDNVEEFNSPSVVKVVFDYKNFALYFSRSPIPVSYTHLTLPTSDLV